MTHNFTFKDSDNFGHILYNFADKFERGGNFVKKKGYYSMYIKCLKKEVDALVKKATAYKIKSLKSEIVEKEKSVIKLRNELRTYTGGRGLKTYR